MLINKCLLKNIHSGFQLGFENSVRFLGHLFPGILLLDRCICPANCQLSNIDCWRMLDNIRPGSTLDKVISLSTPQRNSGEYSTRNPYFAKILFDYWDLLLNIVTKSSDLWAADQNFMQNIGQNYGKFSENLTSSLCKALQKG